MKLIDLLVRELPKRGGWPDGAIEAGFYVVIPFYILSMKMVIAHQSGELIWANPWKIMMWRLV